MQFKGVNLPWGGCFFCYFCVSSIYQLLLFIFLYEYLVKITWYVKSVEKGHKWKLVYIKSKIGKYYFEQNRYTRSFCNDYLTGHWSVRLQTYSLDVCVKTKRDIGTILFASSYLSQKLSEYVLSFILILFWSSTIRRVIFPNCRMSC